MDHELDIASDLSVFHRVDDPEEMPAPLYFDRAERLAHYRGVIRDYALAESEGRTSTTSTTTPATGSRPQAAQPAGGTTTVEASRGAIETNPALAGLFDWE